MHPFLKYTIAGVAELILIATLFWSVDEGSLHHPPTFSFYEAILWTFVSLLMLGVAIYLIQRSVR